MRVLLQPGSETAAAQRESDVPAPEEVLDAAPDRSLQALVAPLDSNHDFGHREHILEADQNRDHALSFGPYENPAQPRRLSVPTRANQAKGMTTFGESQEIVGFGIPINHLLGRQGA